MLILAIGSCDVCGGNLPYTEQEARVTCQKCGKKYKLCLKCKAKGCPKCSGKVESDMDKASNVGMMF